MIDKCNQKGLTQFTMNLAKLFLIYQLKNRVRGILSLNIFRVKGIINSMNHTSNK